MKNTELKKKTDAELMKMLEDKKLSLQAFRFGGAGTRARNVKHTLVTRRDVARIMTEVTTRKQAVK